MSDLPELEKSEDLAEAIRDLKGLRTDFLFNGLDIKRFRDLVEAVRRVDAEIVSAIHERRVREMSPYYPESFQAEEDGYEAAEKWLRAALPKEWEL